MKLLKDFKNFVMEIMVKNHSTPHLQQLRDWNFLAVPRPKTDPFVCVSWRETQDKTVHKRKKRFALRSYQIIKK